MQTDSAWDMPYSAIKVANEFLELARKDTPPKLITPLKLIKLVYIANGWSLALLDRPIVNESSEAWTYGPVIPMLYRAVRHYKSDPIIVQLGGDNDPTRLSEQDRELVSAVYKAYSHLSGVQLSNLTHREGTPWSQAWADGHGRNRVIDSEAIKRHYKELAQQRTTQS